jgi:hypothetical protein
MKTRNSSSKETKMGGGTNEIVEEGPRSGFSLSCVDGAVVGVRRRLGIGGIERKRPGKREEAIGGGDADGGGRGSRRHAGRRTEAAEMQREAAVK